MNSWSYSWKSEQLWKESFTFDGTVRNCSFGGRSVVCSSNSPMGTTNQESWWNFKVIFWKLSDWQNNRGKGRNKMIFDANATTWMTEAINCNLFVQGPTSSRIFLLWINLVVETDEWLSSNSSLYIYKLHSKYNVLYGFHRALFSFAMRWDLSRIT